MAKAERACSSARAALLASGAPVRPDIGKTHSGLINAFSEHLIKNGKTRTINKFRPARKELRRQHFNTGDDRGRDTLNPNQSRKSDTHKN